MGLEDCIPAVEVNASRKDGIRQFWENGAHYKCAPRINLGI
jgi:hypothetical protein